MFQIFFNIMHEKVKVHIELNLIKRLNPIEFNQATPSKTTVPTSKSSSSITEKER